MGRLNILSETIKKALFLIPVLFTVSQMCGKNLTFNDRKWLGWVRHPISDIETEEWESSDINITKGCIWIIGTLAADRYGGR